MGRGDLDYKTLEINILKNKISEYDKQLELLKEEYEKLQPKKVIKDVEYKLSYCETCHIIRDLRVFHCSRCGRCIQRHDHHCPWTSKCVGRYNKYFFYIFTTSIFIFIFFTFSIVFFALLNMISK